MNPETLLKLVLLLGVVLLVVAIGIRARLDGLLRLLRRPAPALRAVGDRLVRCHFAGEPGFPAPLS